jgi:hypothetical protein
MSVDGRGKAVHEVVDDRVSASHPHKLIFLIVIEVHSALLSFESVFLQNSEGNQIDVSIEYGLEIAFDPLHFDRLSSINSDYLHSITWPDAIHIVIVADDSQGVRSLAFRHELGQFLEFDVLFVCKLA